VTRGYFRCRRTRRSSQHPAVDGGRPPCARSGAPHPHRRPGRPL